MKFRRPIILLSGLFLLAAACSQKPKTVHLNSDECAHCKMMITDPRFAAQIVTSTGKAIKFDAIECMADFYPAMDDEMKRNAKLWVSDFENPNRWIAVDEATFIKSEQIQSPMGESLLALQSREKAEEHLNTYPGKIVNWNDIKNE